MTYILTTELYHHGIKGQKWGIRRFQNPDGSLTEAGKRRYSDVINDKKQYVENRGKSKEIKKVNDPGSDKKNGFFDPTIKSGKDKAPQSPAEKLGNSLNKSIDSGQDVAKAINRINSRKNKKPSIAKTMSDDELRAAIARLDLERRYDSLTTSETSAGMEYATDILAIAGGVVGVVGGLASAYAALKFVK